VALVELRQHPLDLPGVAADNAERPEVVPSDGADLVDEADQVLGRGRLNPSFPRRHEPAIVRQQARPPGVDVREEQPVLAGLRAQRAQRDGGDPERMTYERHRDVCWREPTALDR
jgi:hypothetical protein